MTIQEKEQMVFVDEIGLTAKLSCGYALANAKHSVARKMVSTISAMWRTGNEYDEKFLEDGI